MKLENHRQRKLFMQQITETLIKQIIQLHAKFVSLILKQIYKQILPFVKTDSSDFSTSFIHFDVIFSIYLVCT